ncbi:MAG: hypothetical protein Q7R98_01190 [Candidatus Jorgensenbacteria bacterium]|nr:hypothetical protein [Candidatus Jorgensenbacteria bacterium]
MSKGKEKSPLVQIAGQLESVVTGISAGLKERNVSIIEAIGKLAQPNSREAVRKIVNAIADLFIETKICFLKSIEKDVKVSSPAFSKTKFFDSKDGMKISTGSNFYNWVLPEISETVPEFKETFSSFDLTKGMTDGEIRSEIGNGTLTPDEWIAKTRVLVLEQPSGENGHLASDYKSNIDYIQLKSGRIVAVPVYWLAVDRRWYLGAYDLGGIRWDGVSRVFVRG